MPRHVGGSGGFATLCTIRRATETLIQYNFAVCGDPILVLFSINSSCRDLPIYINFNNILVKKMSIELKYYRFATMSAFACRKARHKYAERIRRERAAHQLSNNTPNVWVGTNKEMSDAKKKWKRCNSNFDGECARCLDNVIM